MPYSIQETEAARGHLYWVSITISIVTFVDVIGGLPGGDASDS